jgi:hypothetical protein
MKNVTLSRQPDPIARRTNGRFIALGQVSKRPVKALSKRLGVDVRLFG